MDFKVENPEESLVYKGLKPYRFKIVDALK
jgi:hypothetical protein